MSENEKQANNERLARLCGLEPYRGVSKSLWFDTTATVAKKCVIELPDFYAEDSGTWRERARLALMAKNSRLVTMFESFHDEYDQHLAYNITICFTGNMDFHAQGRDHSYIEAHNAAILKALDLLAEDAEGKE